MFKKKWGTLMHIILPSSVDAKGVNYVADSFKIESYSGLNQIHGLNIPFEWSNDQWI